MTGALEGVKIADFSWVGAGPRATKDLADHGATVVKVESRKRLDLGRLSPPFKDGKRDPDGSAFFAITNTSKLGVTINLSDPRGIDVAKKLIAWADVVVENFGKGFMERIGLGFDTLKALKPDLIYLSVSVAGREGPMSDLRGYGNSAAALSGLAALSGWPDREPHMPPFAYGDVVAPMFATVAVLAALEHRRVTGEGSWLDVSQVEPLVHVLGDAIARAQIDGLAKPVPRGVYPARGHDQWIAIDVRDDVERARLLGLAGIYTNPFPGESRGPGSQASRQRNPGPRLSPGSSEDLNDLLAAWTATQDKHLLADLLQRKGIPAEPVADGRDVFTDPELALGSHFVPITHPVLGDCEMPGPPAEFARSEIAIGPPPRLGEHNHQVFVEMLGIDVAEIAALSEAGVLS